MPDWLLLLKRIFLEFYGWLVLPQKVFGNLTQEKRKINSFAIFSGNLTQEKRKINSFAIFSRLGYFLTYFVYQKESCDYSA